MKQSQIIKLVDFLSFIALLLIVSTGTLLEFTLPVRSGRASVLGMTRHEWGDIHLYVSLFFLTMMSLHLLTHLNYIKQVFLGRATAAGKYRIGVGLIGVIALLLILLTPLFVPVEEGEPGPGGLQGYRRHYHRGSE